MGGQKTVRVFSTNKKAVWADNLTSGGANLTTWGAKVDQGLTLHGATVLSAMGKYYAAEAQSLGADCAHVTAYADFGKTRRDIDTAHAFLGGMLPLSCNVSRVVHSADIQNQTKFLFNQGGNPFGACILPSQAIVDGSLGGNASKYVQAEHRKIDAVSDALQCCQPSLCANHHATRGGSGAGCTLMQSPAPKWNPVAFWSLYSGPLAIASNLGEWIQMMYLNNLDVSGLVGEAIGEDASAISGLTEAHQANMDITDASLWTARSFSSDLLAHIVATIEQLFADDPSAAANGLVSKSTDKVHIWIPVVNSLSNLCC